MLRPASSIVLSALLAGSAVAGPMDPQGGSPRAIGRAGVGVVSDDSAGALQINPAGIARREGWRVQLGISFLDDGIAWTAKNAPVSRDQAGSSVLPTVGVVGSFGEWIVAGGVMTSGVMNRSLRDPADVPVASIHPMDPTKPRAFEYRYAGIEGGLRRDTLAIGVARRVTDTVAIGLSTGLSRISAHETRRMWVGFESAVKDGLDNPERDVQVELDGTTIVPHATLGALVAPEDTPLELALSIGWVKRPTVHGSISGATFDDGGPVFRATDPTASLIVRQPIAIHAGGRYVGDRVTVEIGGDLWLASNKARKVAWELTGVRVANTNNTVDISTELDGVPSRYTLRSHGAVRVAGDVEIIDGFLWATAGYAFTVGGTTESRLSPTFGDLGGHTIALGVEGTKGGVTYTIGWSRTLSRVTSRESELRLDNPFAAGDTFVPDGSYDGSSDQVGVLLDLELDAP